MIYCISLKVFDLCRQIFDLFCYLSFILSVFLLSNSVTINNNSHKLGGLHLCDVLHIIGFNFSLKPLIHSILKNKKKHNILNQKKKNRHRFICVSNAFKKFASRIDDLTQSKQNFQLFQIKTETKPL